MASARYPASARSTDDLARPKQSLEHVGDVFTAHPVGAGQHPDGFNDRHQRDETRPLRRKALDDPGGGGGLRRVVLRQVSHQHIGIDSDQSRRAPASMAACMSSRPTGRSGLGTMPFKDRIEWEAGTTA